MKKAVAQRETLLAETIEAVGQRGLAGVSLRHLAQATGLSTTAIFQNFCGKAELLAHAADLSRRRDQYFHDALAKDVVGAVSAPLAFADFLARYVDLRASSPDARFLSELLLGGEDARDCADILAGWYQDRIDFWTAAVARFEAPTGFGSTLAQFVTMEEFYAYALQDDCAYGLLLSETCRAVCDAALNTGQAAMPQSHVSLTLDTQPLSLRTMDGTEDAPIKDNLLSEAVRIIARDGLEALNQRRLAREAGVSTSAVAYYFNDMKTFRQQAIWRALVVGIPRQLNPESSAVEQPRDLDAWLDMIDDLLSVDPETRDGGFYVSFARLTGQACLLSCQDPSLRPLVAYLRALEGWGTWRATRAIPVLADKIAREHAAAFAMWIKADAILRRTQLVGPETDRARIQTAADHILPRAA